MPEKLPPLQPFQRELLKKFSQPMPIQSLHSLHNADIPQLDLPTTTRTEPIRAWKAARLVRLADGRLRFRGIVYVHNSYGVEGNFTCCCWTKSKGRQSINWFPHSLPTPRSSCGFYAVTHKTRLRGGGYLSSPMNWVLEVDLLGRVVRHSLDSQDAWRASRLRVLAVHGSPTYPLISGEHQEIVEVERRYYANQTYLSHAIPTIHDGQCRVVRRYTPAELAAELGTEVKLG